MLALPDDSIIAAAGSHGTPVDHSRPAAFFRVDGGLLAVGDAAEVVQLRGYAQGPGPGGA
ncbi:hypothetical protein Acsp06_51330 [Actinomycetospora sp. NBRC 106375]|nr:hypothetical protein Acsp06_51330 [Actinomycetospora sp. NBRC 106375]